MNVYVLGHVYKLAHQAIRFLSLFLKQWSLLCVEQLSTFEAVEDRKGLGLVFLRSDPPYIIARVCVGE